MVIYTKTGDDGFSTVNHQRLIKSDIYFELLGELDSTNAYLGLLRVSLPKEIDTLTIQRTLIKLSSHIAGYLPEANFQAEISYLENNIDDLEQQNKPLKNFILPGGNFNSAYMHIIRTKIRKSERCLIAVQTQHHLKIQASALQYLNRLSDYCFVLARYLNAKGQDDILL